MPFNVSDEEDKHSALLNPFVPIHKAAATSSTSTFGCPHEWFSNIMTFVCDLLAI